MTNLKALMEKRAEQQKIMNDLVSAADTEKRAMSEEETAQFDAAEKEIRAIDETIAREERARKVENREYHAPDTAEERAAKEEQEFADYVLGKVSEMRAGEQNMTMANNGAIIPTTIANRIIKAVKDRCPILARATVYITSRARSRCLYGAKQTPRMISQSDTRRSSRRSLRIPASSRASTLAGISRAR